MKRFTPLVVSGLFIVVPSFAMTPLAASAFNTLKPTLTIAPATKLRMGQYTVAFEETTLSAVLKEVGIGRISFHGDGSGGISWLCYTIGNRADAARLWIASDAEMGGPQMFVDEIEAQNVAGAQGSADCPSLPLRFAPLSIDRGIWLGVRERLIRSLLGAPSRRRGSWLAFDYVGKAPGDCKPDGFDVSSYAFIDVRQRLVVSLQAGHITSC